MELRTATTMRTVPSRRRRAIAGNFRAIPPAVPPKGSMPPMRKRLALFDFGLHFDRIPLRLLFFFDNHGFLNDFPFLDDRLPVLLDHGFVLATTPEEQSNQCDGDGNSQTRHSVSFQCN